MNKRIYILTIINKENSTKEERRYSTMKEMTDEISKLQNKYELEVTSRKRRIGEKV